VKDRIEQGGTESGDLRHPNKEEETQTVNEGHADDAAADRTSVRHT